MSLTFIHILLVGSGGFLGAIGRFALSQYVNKKFSFQLPVATLFVNIVGSFFLGMIIGAEVTEQMYLLLGVGLMGSFTTFSTFKLEGIQLHVNKKWKLFLAYNVISYGCGILFAFIGFIVSLLFI